MASLELAIAAAVAHYTKDADTVREYIGRWRAANTARVREHVARHHSEDADTVRETDVRRRAENTAKELEHAAPYLPAKLWKIAKVYRPPA